MGLAAEFRGGKVPVGRDCRAGGADGEGEGRTGDRGGGNDGGCDCVRGGGEMREGWWV